MLHYFYDNKCKFCGVNLAKSGGYNEHCPARRDPTVYSDATSVRPSAVICYRCHSSIIPRIVQQNTVRGAVDLPVAGHHLLIPVQQARHHLECPNCGAPFADDDMIRELNGEMSEENQKVMWLFILLFCLIVVLLIGHSLATLPN